MQNRPTKTLWNTVTVSMCVVQQASTPWYKKKPTTAQCPQNNGKAFVAFAKRRYYGIHLVHVALDMCEDMRF